MKILFATAFFLILALIIFKKEVMGFFRNKKGLQDNTVDTNLKEDPEKSEIEETGKP